MVVVNKRAPSLGGFSQERLAKEDIRLIIQAVVALRNAGTEFSNTRLEMLIEKLKRMER